MRLDAQFSPAVNVCFQIASSSCSCSGSRRPTATILTSELSTIVIVVGVTLLDWS